MMKLSTFFSSVLAAAVMVTAGCNGGPGGGGARPVDDSEAPIYSLHGVNIQEWDKAADELTRQMLQRMPAPPAGTSWIVGVSAIRNETGDYDLPVHVLADKITNVLSGSGVAKTLAYDKVARQTAEFNHMSDPKRYPPPPEIHFTLDGVITQLDARQGRTRERTFVFQMRLNDTSTGVTEWQGQSQLKKRGTQSGVGW